MSDFDMLSGWLIRVADAANTVEAFAVVAEIERERARRELPAVDTSTAGGSFSDA